MPRGGDGRRERFGQSVDVLPGAALGDGHQQGINPGYPLGHDYPELADGLLVAITEQRTREQIDRLADVLESAVAAELEAYEGVKA